MSRTNGSRTGGLPSVAYDVRRSLALNEQAHHPSGLSRSGVVDLGRASRRGDGGAREGPLRGSYPSSGRAANFLPPSFFLSFVAERLGVRKGRCLRPATVASRREAGPASTPGPSTSCSSSGSDGITSMAWQSSSCDPVPYTSISSLTLLAPSSASVRRSGPLAIAQPIYPQTR